MSFLPKNRYVLVELQQEPQEEESTVLLPEDYKPKRPGYVVARVLKTSYDTNYTPIIKEGDKVVVVRSMVEEIQVERETYFVVLENHILGILG